MVANSLDGAFAGSTGQEEVFVIGGERIYREALPIADRMYLTHVHACVAGDTWFPQFDPGDWEMTREENHEADDENPYSFTFRVYDRTKPSVSRQHAARP
jgi:dihydrofolate reductase